MPALKELLKSFFKGSPKPKSEREVINGSEFLTTLEDRVKDNSKTTCIFLKTNNLTVTYLQLQDYLHVYNSRTPQDIVSIIGGNRIGIVLSADYETAKGLINKFKEDYQQLAKIDFTLSEYSQAKNFKDFLTKAQTER